MLMIVIFLFIVVVVIIGNFPVQQSRGGGVIAGRAVSVIEYELTASEYWFCRCLPVG